MFRKLFIIDFEMDSKKVEQISENILNTLTIQKLQLNYLQLEEENAIFFKSILNVLSYIYHTNNLLPIKKQCKKKEFQNDQLLS